MTEFQLPIKEGVLAAVSGPCYETPAEAQMLAILGSDAVCMSTIPEVIIANYLDLRVIGLSLITNKSAAKGAGKISHESVLAMAVSFQQKIYQLLSKLWGII